MAEGDEFGDLVGGQFLSRPPEGFFSFCPKMRAKLLPRFPSERIRRRFQHFRYEIEAHVHASALA